MNDDKCPPPYLYPPFEGPSAAVSSQPAAYPGSPYQTFPQSYTGGGDQSYYQGPPGQPGPPEPYLTQPGYQGYYNGPPQTSYPYSENPKHTVFMDEQNRHNDDDDGCHYCRKCLAGCSAVLCCCCIWEMLS